MTNEEAATLLEQWSDEGLSDGFNEAATMGAAALRSPGAGAMREACFEVADEVATMCAEDPSVVGIDADPKHLGAALTEIVDRCVANHCALPAPEVPWPVRAYAEWLDDCRNALDDNDVPMKNLRSWIMEEYGI